MNTKTFRIGGVHPEENKLTHEVPTQVAPLPQQAVFPLSQHIGAPAKAVVKKGDKVKTGQALGTVDTIGGETQLHFQIWSGKTPQNPEIWLRPR